MIEGGASSLIQKGLHVASSVVSAVTAHFASRPANSTRDSIRVLHFVESSNPLRTGTIRTAEAIESLEDFVDSDGRKLRRECDYYRAWIGGARDIAGSTAFSIESRIVPTKALCQHDLRLD